MPEFIETGEGIELKGVTSQHSYASGRVVINQNFETIQRSMDILITMPVNDLSKLIFPDLPATGTDYVMAWSGDKYEIVPATSQHVGTRRIINPSEDIRIVGSNQYLIHNLIDIEGSLDLEGELVIL